MLERNAYRLLALAGVAAGAVFAGDNQSEPIQYTVANGTAAFVTDTNVPAVTIKGKSTALQAQVIARRDAQGLHIDKIEAALPVKTLQTGMGLRDDHMRKYIFTTAGGAVPDLIFRAEGVNCAAGAPMTYPVRGSLTIRRVAHAFAIPLKVREDGDGFKAAGESIIKLSDYGIGQPRQFGVKTGDQSKSIWTSPPGRPANRSRSREERGENRATGRRRCGAPDSDPPRPPGRARFPR